MSSSVATVVIPTFNRADLLPAAVNSVLEQTVDCEIIIVDHGSTDSTPVVARQWGDRVVYLRREFDSGPQFSWLDGVLIASHEFVKILHDDDWLEPTFVEQSIALMAPDVGFVFTAATVTDENKAPINTLFASVLKGSGTYTTRQDRRVVAETMISPTALMLRKQELIDGIYVDRLPFQQHRFHGAGADHFLKLLALLRYPKFGYVSEPLANFRSHAGSITIDAISSGRKSGLTAVYSETLSYYRVLDFIQRGRLIALVNSLHRIQSGLAAVINLFGRYARQVQRVGLVPLRFRNKT